MVFGQFDQIEEGRQRTKGTMIFTKVRGHVKKNEAISIPIRVVAPLVLIYLGMIRVFQYFDQI